MTDQELIKFGKEVRRLAENPFQRQLEEARREWKLFDGNESANRHTSDSVLCPTKVSYNKHDGKKAKPARGH